MKRLLAIALTLSVASCDTSMKAADGTSSETQTALQALADNVRKIPASPSFSWSGDGATAAGRVMWVDACPDYPPIERYWHDDTMGASYGNVWLGEWSRLVACTPDSTVRSVFTMFRRADDSTTWTVVSEVIIPATTGIFTIRSTYESALGAGFRRRYRVVRYPGGSLGVERPGPIREDLEDVLTNGFIEVDFLELKILNNPIDLQTIPDLDTIDYRFPIYDLTRGRVKIGDFYRWRGKRIEVRDLEGRVIAPRIPPPLPQPDSMGLRLLANTSDADSIRLSLRLQTVEPAGFAPAATALILADSAARRWYDADSLPRDERVLTLGSVGFADGKRIDWRVPRSGAYDRVFLLRSYPGESMTDWQLVAIMMLDGRLVSP